MIKNRVTRSGILCVLLASITLAGCTSTTTTPTATTVTPPVAPAPVVTPKTLATPAAVSPLSGATVDTKPTLTVVNAVRTGTLTGPVTYLFEVADNPGFSPLTASGSTPEGGGVTTFTLVSDLAGGKTYYWRATAIDVTDALTSPAGSPQSVATLNVSTAGKIAAQENLALWPGTQPPGTAGQAILGNGWGIVSTVDFQGHPFVSPTIDNLRVFDLLDRGMNPNSVVGWINSNGYGTNAVFYGSVAQGVFGFPQNYLTLIGTSWTLVTRVGS